MKCTLWCMKNTFSSKHKINFVPFLYVKDCGLFKTLENSFITKGEGEVDQLKISNKKPILKVCKNSEQIVRLSNFQMPQPQLAA